MTAILDKSLLQAPFPWFGGKSTVSDIVWERFGNVPNYVEPFFGSGAVLLNRPEHFGDQCETVNDKDGFVANAWRAIAQDPEQAAHYADWPVNENDLNARHAYLTERRSSLVAKLEGDPDYFDAKIAGWWIWGMCAWIGGEFCSGKGPWKVIDGELVNVKSSDQKGISRKRPHLSNKGQGINRQCPHLGNKGQGINRKKTAIYEWFEALSNRLCRVRVCCGDWSRICGPSPTTKIGLTGVFLDPPYCSTDREAELYTVDCTNIAKEVEQWCLENGNNKLLRIALCGYEGDYNFPDTWECVPWKAKGGYGNQGNSNGAANAHKERIWFSPHCLQPMELF